jgi:hypothetical protein
MRLKQCPICIKLRHQSNINRKLGICIICVEKLDSGDDLTLEIFSEYVDDLGKFLLEVK